MSLVLPSFDEDLQSSWPDEEMLFKNDIEEAIEQQLVDCEKQKREAPYYNIWTATGFTYLTTIYTTGSPLRLEATAQAEIPYKPNLTKEEKERALDPDYRDDGRERSSEPSPSQRHNQRMNTELRSNFTNTKYWTGPANPEGRRSNAATKPIPAATTQPEATSQSAPPSAASSAVPPPMPTIYRVADGLFFRREKMGSFRSRDLLGTTPPAVPVASVEVKVPRWNSQNVKDAGQGEEVEEVEEVGDKVKVWIIREKEAQKAIETGMAQIVQQVQFIFHNWNKLNVVWAIGASGRWAQFFRFTRDGTPEIDYATISNETDDVKGPKYYPGPEPHEIPDPAESAPSVFEAVNIDGSFTEEFKEYWRRVIDDAEKEFLRMEGLRPAS